MTQKRKGDRGETRENLSADEVRSLILSKITIDLENPGFLSDEHPAREVTWQDNSQSIEERVGVLMDHYDDYIDRQIERNHKNYGVVLEPLDTKGWLATELRKFLVDYLSRKLINPFLSGKGIIDTDELLADDVIPQMRGREHILDACRKIELGLTTQMDRLGFTEEEREKLRYILEKEMFDKLMPEDD